MPRRRWVKLWTQETLYGTTTRELDLEERAIWFGLLCLAGDSPEPGTICIAPGPPYIAYTNDQLAAILNAPLDVLERAIAKMLAPEVNKLMLNGAGCLAIRNWQKYQTDWQRIQNYPSQQPTTKPTQKPTGIPDQTRPDQKGPDKLEITNVISSVAQNAQQNGPKTKKRTTNANTQQHLALVKAMNDELGYEVCPMKAQMRAAKEALHLGYTPDDVKIAVAYIQRQAWYTERDPPPPVNMETILKHLGPAKKHQESKRANTISTHPRTPPETFVRQADGTIAPERRGRGDAPS